MKRLLLAVFTLGMALTGYAQTTPTTQVKTIADLVALGIPTINNRLSALVTGRVTENDGGGGVFFYDGASAVTTNLGTVFKPAASSGRWIREFSGAVNVKWFGAIGDNATDATTAIQAALNYTSQTNAVYVPPGVYVISESLTFPGFNAGSISTVELFGDGSLSSILINRATADKPTLLINKSNATVHDLGFLGDGGYPNNGIKVASGGQLSTIRNCWIDAYGDGIWVEATHSLTIKDNYGAGNNLGAVRTQWAGSSWSWASTNAFIKIAIPNAGFMNHLVVTGNKNESYPYQLYTAQAGSGYGFSFFIRDNQWEGATSGIYLKGVYDGDISGNYLGEGSTGYSIDMDACRNWKLGPNYIHFSGSESLNSTIRLNDVQSTFVCGGVNRIVLTGTTDGNVITGFVDYIQDESSDRLTSYVNVRQSQFATPNFTVNRINGQGFISNNDATTVGYPYTKVGDLMWNTSTTTNTVPGWVCVTNSYVTALSQTVGVGPAPSLLQAFYHETSADFRVTVQTGGATGTATYEVESKTPPGGGAFAVIATAVASTELAHFVGASFGIKWPTGATYVSGDQWTFTGYTAGWVPMLPLPTAGGNANFISASIGPPIYTGNWNQQFNIVADGSNGFVGARLRNKGTAAGDDVGLIFDTETSREGIFGIDRSTGLFTFGGGTDFTLPKLTISLSGNETINYGDLTLATAGNGFKVKEGSNARMGTATLVGGTIAVANTSVTANTRIFISRSTTGGTEGHLSTTQIASTSFTVNSSSGTDTSTVNWLLIEPSP
jgi:hypothetical protein